MTSLKVALISFHSFLRPGGVKRHLLGLHSQFKGKRVFSKIIVPRRKSWENYGRDVILLGTSFPFPFSGGQSDLAIHFNPWSINKVLAREKFDVLHFHNFGFPSSLQILERSKSLNILTFHANPQGSEFLKSFPIFLDILNKICQWKIDGIIGVSNFILKFFKNYQGPKIFIPNGIDLKEFNPKVPKIKKFQDGKINILFVGRIEKRKGLIYLLKAFKILTEKFSYLRLIIVGDGELKKECQNFVKNHNLKEVFFEGEKEGKIVPRYYNSSDIFVSPAIFGESFGIVLVEAMALGKPVVAFNIDGYREVLGQGKGKNFLVKTKDYKGLAQKIEILIENPKLRKEMGEWGLKRVQNYSWSKIADQVLEFYHLCQKEKRNKIS